MTHALSPRPEKDAAASRKGQAGAAADLKDKAAPSRLPLAGKTLPPATQAQRRQVPLPLAGKPLPLATKAVRQHMHLPITGKALPPAKEAQRHQNVPSHHWEGAAAGLEGRAAHCALPHHWGRRCRRP